LIVTHQPVIARSACDEAIHREARWDFDGLLRRDAPRNDDDENEPLILAVGIAHRQKEGTS